MVAVAAAGAFVQRVTGFGFAIFTMIFLTMLLPSYGEANLLAGFLSMTTTCFVAWNNRKHIQWKKVILLFLPQMVFMLLAVRWMKNISDSSQKTMNIILGSVLLLLSIWFLFVVKRVHVKETPVVGLICGSVSGIMAGMFSMGGPPIAFYLLETSKSDKLVYLATIQTYFFFTNVYGTVVKSLNGYMTRTVLIFAAAGVVGMFLGTVVGKKVFSKLNAGLLRTIVYAFMGISGIVNIVTALLK